MILVDISHPAHVHFFRPVTEALRNDGLDVRIVARDKDVTVQLLDAYDLAHEVLPMEHRAHGRASYARELIRRTSALRDRIRDWDTRLVLTRNPSGVLAATGTPAQSIFDTDDGRSAGAHYWAARPFSDVITSSVHDPERHGRKHIRYPALKAHMFLHPANFRPDNDMRRQYLAEDEILSVVRFSAHDASHDRHIDGISTCGRDAVLSRLLRAGPVLLSVERQGLRLVRSGTAPAAAGIPVPPEYFHHLLATASLFVGDSQSVAAEAAVLGVPSLRLSGFTGKVFYLELLESRGLMQNFSPGEEAGLFSAIDESLLDLEHRRAVARNAAQRLNSESENLAQWYVRLAKERL